MRSPLFTQQASLDALKKYADSIQGIQDISANLQTGSVTIRYDPALISLQMAMNAKTEIEKRLQDLL